MLNGFVALPADAQLLIQGFVVALVALVIQLIVVKVPFLAFLKNYAAEWGLLLSAAVLDALQNALPTGYEDLSIKGVFFALALIGAFVKFAKSRNVQGLA